MGLQAANKGNVDDVHRFDVTEWNIVDETLPDELKKEATFVERCAFGLISETKERNENNDNNDNNENNENNYFSTLFNLLAVPNLHKDVLSTVWNLITALPVELTTKYTLLLNCNENSLWKEIMFGNAPLQQLYSIQLITTMLSNNAVWCMQYINSGGFQYLVNEILIHNSSIAVLLDNSMSRECVTLILQLFNSFLKKSEGNENSQTTEEEEQQSFHTTSSLDT